MNTFHHGGRLGDAIYSLYTVKALGGGHVIISDFHQGNWGEAQARSLLPLLQHQDYISGAHFQYARSVEDVTYDLHDAELDHNPEAFPEWHGKVWPGNIHIAKRYAVHFGVEWKPGSTWLTAPATKDVQVAFHAPMRRTTKTDVLAKTLQKLGQAGIETAIIDPDSNWQFGNSWAFYPQTTIKLDGFPTIQRVVPQDMLDAADWINSAKVFFGAVSSNHAIAEALGKPRYVQMADGCDNVIPTAFVNGWSADRLYQAITSHL